MYFDAGPLAVSVANVNVSIAVVLLERLAIDIGAMPSLNSAIAVARLYAVRPNKRGTTDAGQTARPPGPPRSPAPPGAPPKARPPAPPGGAAEAVRRPGVMQPDGPARAIPDYYGTFTKAGPSPDAIEAWEGFIRPFLGCGDDAVALVLDDLRAGASVLVGGGSLSHATSCGREHCRPSCLAKMTGAGAECFRVRVLVWPPPRHPKIFAIYPEISKARYARHPHLFQHAPVCGVPGSLVLPDALCTYRPGDGEWSWDTGDLVTFLDYASIFLAKHVVWVRTGGDHGGLWMGPQASHRAPDMLRELSPVGECRCASGKRYEACCRPKDIAQAEAETYLESLSRAIGPSTREKGLR
jgi:hypothetical protein